MSNFTLKECTSLESLNLSGCVHLCIHLFKKSSPLRIVLNLDPHTHKHMCPPDDPTTSECTRTDWSEVFIGRWSYRSNLLRKRRKRESFPYSVQSTRKTTSLHLLEHFLVKSLAQRILFYPPSENSLPCRHYLSKRHTRGYLYGQTQPTRRKDIVNF